MLKLNQETQTKRNEVLSLKRIISLIILIFLTFSFMLSLVSCDISGLPGSENNGELGGENNENEENGKDEIFSKIYYGLVRGKVELASDSFNEGEEIKLKYYFGVDDRIVPGFSIMYYYIFLKDLDSGEEYLIKYADENISGEDLVVDTKFDSAREEWIFAYSEDIIIPTEFLNKDEGSFAICASFNFTPGINSTQPYYAHYGSENASHHDVWADAFSYAKENGKISFTADKNYLYPASSLDAEDESLIKVPVLDPTGSDISHVEINASGYSAENVTVGFYFGRNYRGSAEQQKSLFPNIGKASVYLESDDGKSVLLATTDEDYISEKYKIEFIRNYSHSKSYAVYKKANCLGITIPRELLAGECGILFLSVVGENGEKLSEVPLQYRVEGEGVYLSNRFIMHKDDNSNLDFYLGQKFSEEELNELNPMSGVEKFFEVKRGNIRYLFNNPHGDEYEVCQISLADDSANIYGITVNSTDEEFKNVFESLGYKVSEYRDADADSALEAIGASGGSCLVAYRNGVAIFFNRNYIVSDGQYAYIDMQNIIIDFTPTAYSYDSLASEN